MLTPSCTICFSVPYLAMYGIEKIVFLDKPVTVEPIASVLREDDPDFRK